MSPGRPTDEDLSGAQVKRAARLRSQIEELKRRDPGTATNPISPNEFIERKMADEARKTATTRKVDKGT
jgi:hypothetical protein